MRQAGQVATTPEALRTLADSLLPTDEIGRRSLMRPEQLVSYLGLNPRVRPSGGCPASHGRITKQGRAHARGMLVDDLTMKAARLNERRSH